MSYHRTESSKTENPVHHCHVCRDRIYEKAQSVDKPTTYLRESHRLSRYWCTLECLNVTLHRSTWNGRLDTVCRVRNTFGADNICAVVISDAQLDIYARLRQLVAWEASQLRPVPDLRVPPMSSHAILAMEARQAVTEWDLDHPAGVEE
jgi:hypothetical protein